MRDRSNTFQILSRQEDRTQMVVFDERADLRADRGAIEAHHKELAHLPGIATWLVSMISYTWSPPLQALRHPEEEIV